ncbi:MAG TPA: metallophosphoesterase [Candidatus Saccharimonadaceae bacterium]|nr:metallophosphoesterase [Candidatus Saccharimonadaceae bacterium]
MGEWLFTSDLHGQGALYEQLLGTAAARRPPAVLIGGDLCPHAPGDEGLRRQRVFLEGFLVEFARRLREASPGTRLLLLMGNDDWAANGDCLERHHGDLWHALHERVVDVDGTRVAGLSWVPITPFLLKDWERWDDGAAESPARLDGWISESGRIRPHRFDPASRTPTIADALRALAGEAPVRETVVVTHSPAHGTHCDMIGGGTHVGSRAIRAFVEEHQPPLVLSGHIHESPRIASAYRDRVGDTILVNPGQFGTARLCAVWVDPARPDATLRHTVYG